MPWIFFPDACCSVVAHQDEPGLLVVRSRLKGDIERILGPVAVEVTPKADYRFRTTVRREVFAEALLRRLGGMTYTNVKAAIPKSDQARAYLMNRIWSAGLDAQIEAANPRRIVVDSFLDEDPTQLDIFRRRAPRKPRPVKTEAHARASDPDTSAAAAASMRPTDTEAAVLDALARCPNGATASELVAIMKGAWNTITPRLAPLCRKGFIQDSGERRKGPTNRSQIVWEALQ